MKLILLLVGAQLVSSQYGPLPARKISRPIPDSVNEIVPPDNPQDHGLNGLAPGFNPLNKATNFWWAGPNSPFKPDASSGTPQILQQHPGDRPASGCPPGGCGAPPPCADGQTGCTPSQISGNVPAGNNPFLGQGYGPRPGSQPQAGGNAPHAAGNPPQPQGGTHPQSSSPTTDQAIDISSNPFLSSALQKPIPSSPDSCTAQNVYCVPSQLCYNGIITDNDSNLQYKYPKGPCSGNHVCCRAGTQPSGSGSFPSGQPGSQFPGTQYPGSQTNSQLPGSQSQPASKFPDTQFGGHSPSAQPGSPFPGTHPQPGSHFPGAASSSQYPSGQPSSQYPGSQQGSNFPGSQSQPGSQHPGTFPQPGVQGSNSQPQPGTQSPGIQTQPGSQIPGFQTQSGSQYPSNNPSSYFPGNQPGAQTGSQFPGARPNYVTESSVNKYTGPLNTEVPPGCAAALKCVAEIYCTAEGVMSDTPVQLTREQLANKVPLTDCQNADSGLIGKCCRDPNYKDPWPAGMMMAKGQGQFDDGLYKGNANFDDGQYRPDHQGQILSPQQQPTSIPNRTIKKPLGVFNTNVTPFPAVIKPQPGQTHSQVFPQNEDKIASSPGFTGTQPGSNQFVNPGIYQQGSVSPGQSVPAIPGHTGSIPSGQPGSVSFVQPGSVSPGQIGSVYPGSYVKGQPQPNQPGSPVSFHPGGVPNTPQALPGQPGSQFPQQSYSPQPGTPNVVIQPGHPSSSGTPHQIPGQLTPHPQPGTAGGLPNPAFPQTGHQQPQQQPNVPSYGSTQEQKVFPPPFPGSAPLTPHHTSPSQPAPQVVPGQECGVRRPPYTDNVDVNTANSEFPWQAIVLSSNNKSALCSGAIISDNAILTSAHCLEGFEAKDLQVKVGNYRLNEPGNTQISNVAAIVPHPSYDSGSLAKDQAVLALEQPLVLNQNVDKVCLPPADNEHYTQNGKTCFVTGWGRPNLQGGLPGTVLHKIEVNLIPNNQCENTLKQTYLGKYFILNDGFSCAQPKYGGDFCKVDIGSPLVCDRGDGHYELAGLYSWDTQCSSQAPAVLTECDSRWTMQVLNTPINTLKAQQNIPRFETSRPEDIDQKPGFALGYGK